MSLAAQRRGGGSPPSGAAKRPCGRAELRPTPKTAQGGSGPAARPARGRRPPALRGGQCPSRRVHEDARGAPGRSGAGRAGAAAVGVSRGVRRGAPSRARHASRHARGRRRGRREGGRREKQLKEGSSSSARSSSRSAATSSTRRPQGLRDIRDAALRPAGGPGRAKREARRAGPGRPRTGAHGGPGWPSERTLSRAFGRFAASFARPGQGPPLRPHPCYEEMQRHLLGEEQLSTRPTSARRWQKSLAHEASVADVVCLRAIRCRRRTAGRDARLLSLAAPGRPPAALARGRSGCGARAPRRRKERRGPRPDLRARSASASAPRRRSRRLR